MSENRKGLLMVIISGLCYGIMPTFTTRCYAEGATPALMLLFRFLTVSLATLPYVLRHGGIVEIYKANWKKLVPLSIVSAATPILLFTSYYYLPTGFVTTIHFLYPTVVMLICLLFFRDKLSTTKLLCIALCLGGVLTMMDTSNVTIHPVGLVMTVCSSVTWALYIVWLEKFKIKGLDSLQLLFFIDSGAFAIIALLYGPLTGTLFVPVTARGYILLICFNFIVGILGSMFFTFGVRKTDAQIAAIASTLEPIMSIVMGVLYLHEPFTLRTAIGSVMILAAVVIISLYNARQGSRTAAA